MKLARSHPNATASAGFGGLAVILIAISKALGYELDPTLAAAGATAITTVGLLIGRKGLRGAVRLVWRGSENAGK